jgi:hypothetical protein
MRYFICLLALSSLLGIALPVQAQENQGRREKRESAPQIKVKKTTKGPTTMQYQIPSSMLTEHKELHTTLAEIIKLSGKTGAAAEAVAKLLHPHFIKEEEYALPVLGLLPLLARGAVTPDMQAAIALTDKLKNSLPEMLKEHQQVVAALETMIQAAREENHPKAVQFAEDLKLHAKTEEEILYPSAILVGEYLKLKL